MFFWKRSVEAGRKRTRGLFPKKTKVSLRAKEYAHKLLLGISRVFCLRPTFFLLSKTPSFMCSIYTSASLELKKMVHSKMRSYLWLKLVVKQEKTFCVRHPLTRISQFSGYAVEKYRIYKILLHIYMTVRNMIQILNNHYKNSPLVLYLNKVRNNFDETYDVDVALLF